jgi:glutamine synthetase
MGGILDHFRALTCIGSPTVNSYKRMWDFVLGAVLQEPAGILTCTVRVVVVASSSVVDSSCNPYLTQAALLGLDGVRRELDGPPQQEHLRPAGRGRVQRVPDHLGEALDALEADEVVAGRYLAVSTMCSCTTSVTSGALPDCCDRLGA